MTIKLIILLFVICVNLTLSATLNRRKMTGCAQISEDVLGEILGPAYNSRYMSIDLPPEVEPQQSLPGIKRAPSTIPEFYVDDDFSQDFGDVPAWKTSHIIQERLMKRDTKENEMLVGEQNLFGNDNSFSKENISNLNYEDTYSEDDIVTNDEEISENDEEISETGAKSNLQEVYYKSERDNTFLFIDKELSDSFRRKVLVRRDRDIASKLSTGKLFIFKCIQTCFFSYIGFPYVAGNV